MKILIASDSYKGSLTTFQVSDAIEEGIKKVDSKIEVIKLPIADGGEGTTEAIVEAVNGNYVSLMVKNPLGNLINCKYGIIDDKIAVMEMAEASGLTLIEKEDRNPLITTTYGTGQMIRHAMENGIERIYIGLGGSATNDAGIGMAQALGISFKDKHGKEIGYGGKEINNIREIDFTNKHPLLDSTEIKIISDVTNPLFGEKGATYVYGRQKGATEKMIDELETNLIYYGELLNKYTGKDINNIPGVGAAGGLGASLIALCNGKIYSGIDKVLDIIKIDEKLFNVDLLITGEGKIDEQSIYGKAPVGVGIRAKKMNIPVIAIVGSVDGNVGKIYDYGIDSIVDIVDKPMTLDYSIENAYDLVVRAAERAVREFIINKEVR